MPAVSVIVPVYKVEPYLFRCIDSILAQTFTNFELILVDDGSPDGCPEICDNYASQDTRIKVLHLQNGGVSKARNAGLDAATGEYIAFCDSDDWWDRTLLSRVMEETEKKDWDWVSFRYRRVNNLGGIQEVNYHTGQWNFETWDNKIQFLCSHFLQYHSGWEIWARLFKREIIELHGIRFCETCNNFAEDMGFCAKYLLCSNSITAIEDCLYNYYLRENSMMAESKQIVKLDEMNEVSYDFGMFAKKTLPPNLYSENIGIVHYLIMYNQYAKLFFTEKYRTLSTEFMKIKRQPWFIKSAFSAFIGRKKLQRYFGQEYAARIVNFSVFCLHRNWYLYTLGRRMIDRKYRKS